MATKPEERGTDFESLLSLHRYFLNADYLRDVFEKRLREQNTRHVSGDSRWIGDHIAMSQWYASVYVVIEGWRECRPGDDRLAVLLKADYMDKLRVFRNQMFHFQRSYDNRKLLHFLGEADGDAEAAAGWIRAVHAALGQAIESELQSILDARTSGR